jgi:drug/metabolite transporter (DMT)-like permease
MYNYVQPIIASLLAIVVGQGSFGIGKLFAAALVFLGVYLVTQSKSREDVEREKQAS